MINTRHPRWYHNFMPHFGIQLMTVGVCGMITLLQMGVYEYIEEDIIVFEGECIIENVSTDEGEATPNLVAQCDEHTYTMNSDQERLVYFHELTTGTRPVIVCVKTVSEYLKDVTWVCDINPDEETEQA